MELGIVWLLRAAWFAGILPIIIAFLPFSRLNWFRAILLGFAKRGKILQSSSQKFTVPQKFFCHFYVLAVIWTTLLLGTTWTYAYVSTPEISEPFNFPGITSQLTGGSSLFPWQKSHSSRREHGFLVWKAVFLLLLMEVQVLRRLYETIYVFNYSPSARMHIFGYLTGLFFYTAAPLSLCSSCIPEVYHFAASGLAQFIVQGKRHMPDVEISPLDAVIPLSYLGWRQWIGAALFFWGWIHQQRCHQILGSLRVRREQSEEYRIPHGDWFEVVSSPHYLAEIVIYGGLVVASGGEDFTIWLLFGFVVVNLAFAAAETHRWSFSSFSPSVRPSSVGRGRGDASPSIRSPPEPDSEPKKPVFFSKNNAGDSAASTSLGGLHRVSGERNLPESLHSEFSGVGRGKPMKQPVPEDQPKQENRHLRPRQEGDGPGAGERGRGRGFEPRIGRGEPWRNTNRMVSKDGPDGEVGGGRGTSGYRGRGARGPYRRGARGSFRTGERRERRSGHDKEDGYAAGLYLGNNEDGERLAKRIGTENMNKLVEGFEEMSGRVLPSPLVDQYLDGMDTNFMIECEPEYLMGDFENNPDIDENPPIPLRDALEKMKPFLMAYENIQSHEEWEEIVEETMQSVPLLKEIVDAYGGPDRVTAKEQQGELERVAKTLPQSAPNSVKQFTNRVVLSLQSNPGWGFDKKWQLMDKLVEGFSKRYK